MNDRVITPADDEWPPQLNELGPAHPPKQLYARGLPLNADRRTVAVVGARRPTAAGVEAAAAISRQLAEAGFTIVSGLAVGIDTAAHRAALDADGYTVAVLGCGLDVDYPRTNQRLKCSIAERGTIITEYSPGTAPLAPHFPQRNRIIAGLSAGVVFVEGGLRSGGRITAVHALEANRAVFAVPGSIRNPLAAGPNELIRTSQATLVTEMAHICEELEPGHVWTDPVGNRVHRARVHLEVPERRILDFLDDAPSTVDLICSAIAMKPGEVALGLSRLEIRGFAHRRAGGYAITGAGARARFSVAQADDPVAETSDANR